MAKHEFVGNATQDGDTPLLISSLNGQVAVVKLLLERRACVNLCNKVGHLKNTLAQY